jgi:serine/threonine protein kinase/Tol biopolymer transport system component
VNPEKWEQAKQLYEAALKHRRDERPHFLAENCGGDEELRREVGSLLAASEEAGEFLEKPAIGEVAEVILAQRSLIGKNILQYKIIAMLGSGGMGEVYLAEDTRLKRKIALKMLPSSLSDDTKSVRRFEQEAYAASALNHPNILTVHEFGEHEGMNFIASEYVRGETLRARLSGGKPFSLPEVLDIALQIAAALAAAHAFGIIHRDIKPENVMIRDDALVKVLDFGLAKLTLKDETVDTEGETALHTTPGMIMGTASYMSPEQARGQRTDARTDIWSLGVVLYEMLAGRPPFKGETASDTMAAILTHEPSPVDQLPGELNRILRKTLQKEADLRYQTVKDLLLDLENFKRGTASVPFLARATADTGSNLAVPTNERPGNLETGAIDNTRAPDTGPAVTARSRLLGRKLITAGVLLALVAGAAAIWKFGFQNRNQASPIMLASLRVRQLISWNAEAGEEDTGARFSPGGTMIAYSLTRNGQSNIWTKQAPDGKPNQVTDGKWDYYNPIWSSDGQRIAFLSNRDNQKAIWMMPFSGGELKYIKAFEGAGINLLNWSKNGEKIYYQERFNVFSLDIASGQTTQLTDFDSINRALFFSISPAEDRIAYSAGPNERLHIFVIPIGGGPAVQVTNDEASDEYPLWLPDGNRIIYNSKREGVFQTCIAYLDEKRTEQINLGIGDTLIRDVAAEGSRILFQQAREESDLWMADATGKGETPVTSDPGLELWPDVSPDGKSIVFQATTESKHLLEGSIRVHSMDDAQEINVAAGGFSPTFSPDGRKVAFLRDADKLINLWIAEKSGADVRQLTTQGVWFAGFSEVPYNRAQVRDYSWSPDSARVVYSAKKDGLWNVWQAAADGNGEPRQISENTDENIRFYGPAIASDGNRVAYTSSPVKAASDGKKITSLDLWNGESSVILFSSEAAFKLIGWSGNDLLIAVPEGKSIAKPVKVKLQYISAENISRDLTSIDAAYFNNIRLSPDGRSIAFTARKDGQDHIRVMSIKGGANIKITAEVEPTTYIAGLAWSPDGRTIYFSKQKQVKTISMIENFK